jgi:hypothetical protein
VGYRFLDSDRRRPHWLGYFYLLALCSRYLIPAVFHPFVTSVLYLGKVGPLSQLSTEDIRLAYFRPNITF